MTDLMKWDPFQDITRFFDEVDKLFAHFMKSFSEEIHSVQLKGNNVNLQVRDEGSEIVITGDIPNAVKDNVDIVLRQDSVLVSGETALQKEKNGLKEYQWSKFSKVCSLPARVNSKGAKIDLKNGKLTIKAPKEPNYKK